VLRYFAPSGSPIKTFELIYWIICNLLFIDKRPEIKNELKKLFKIEHSYIFTTGRGAMTLLLKSLNQINQDDQKNEVIVPAYTCYSVASSVINAGLKIRLCDIDSETLSYDLEQLKQMSFDNVLCIVSANLYGIPNQLDELEKLAISKNVYLIDDAAQSFHATCSNKKLGTFGIAGLFSFDKGKNITSIEGGVIVTNNNELAKVIDNNYEQVPLPSNKSVLIKIIKVIIYYLFINPFLYWLPASLPFLNLGKTKYEDDIEIEKYSRTVAPLALKQIQRSNNITKKRLQNGEWYKNNIKESQNIHKVCESNDSGPVYLRYPMKIQQRNKRDHILNELKRFGVTMSYPKSLNKLEEIKEHTVNPGDYRGAEKISEEIVTLPTHEFITDRIRKTIVDVLNKI
jgi:dTDP-4-amino-4,6-dideoxygalactose transaminase